jgi:aspartate aminotransferase
VPSWNNNHYNNINQGQHCVIEARPENDFMPTAEDIRPHLDGAVLLCLCTPQNPTGTTLGKAELENICTMVIEENERRIANGKRLLYLMFDQIYALLTYGETEHHTPVNVNPKMKDYTIYVDGISKVFAATGVRVGWSFGPVNVISKMKALLSHMGAWAPMPEQKATAEYLNNTADVDVYLQQYKAELQYRLDNIYNGFKALKEKGYAVDVVAPQAAIYLTIRVDLKGQTANGKVLATQDDVTTYLLDEANLAVVPFFAFGGDKDSPWYRLSVGTCKKEDIPKVLALLETALAKLT